MRVLVDTSVWSLALRRQARTLNPSQEAVVRELSRIIGTGRATLIGQIRQELLTGVRNAAVFEDLRSRLGVFPDEVVLTEDHENAARISNQCRSAGVAGSGVDFLICAVAIRLGTPIFTLDQDFARYAARSPLSLYDWERR